MLWLELENNQKMSCYLVDTCQLQGLSTWKFCVKFKTGTLVSLKQGFEILQPLGSAYCYSTKTQCTTKKNLFHMNKSTNTTFYRVTLPERLIMGQAFPFPIEQTSIHHPHKKSASAKWLQSWLQAPWFTGIKLCLKTLSQPIKTEFKTFQYDRVTLARDCCRRYFHIFIF